METKIVISFQGDSPDVSSKVLVEGCSDDQIESAIDSLKSIIENNDSN